MEAKHHLRGAVTAVILSSPVWLKLSLFLVAVGLILECQQAVVHVRINLVLGPPRLC